MGGGINFLAKNVTYVGILYFCANFLCSKFPSIEQYGHTGQDVIDYSFHFRAHRTHRGRWNGY